MYPSQKCKDRVLEVPLDPESHQEQYAIQVGGITMYPCPRCGVMRDIKGFCDDCFHKIVELKKELKDLKNGIVCATCHESN